MLQTMILLYAIESGTNAHLIIDAGTRIWINTYISRYIYIYIRVVSIKRIFSLSLSLFRPGKAKNGVLSKIKCHRNYCRVAIMHRILFIKNRKQFGF